MLQGEAYHARTDFCQQIRLKINESHEFLEKPTFSDEKTYQINGHVNDRVWEDRNIKKSGNMKENPQNSMFIALSGSQALSVLSFLTKEKVSGEC
jgi:hypothetical protein